MKLEKEQKGGHVRQDQNKLDGVGPVDNRPSTDKFHHFSGKKEREKKKNKIVTHDM